MRDIYWQATYKDGSYLQQYNDDGSENLFKDIKHDKLSEFMIVIHDKKYIVSLIDNSFNINKNILLFDNLKNYTSRLIYFRRNRITIPNNTKKTWHCLGLQTTINNTNYKTIIKINENTQNIIVESK